MAELWTALPRRLRLLFGEADGAMPCCDILAKYEDDPDLEQMPNSGIFLIMGNAGFISSTV